MKISVYTYLKKLKKYFDSIFEEKKFYCPVCNKKVYKFEHLPFDYFVPLIKNEYIHNIFKFETLNILEYYCPRCEASDRNRLIASFINDYAKGKDIKLIDFAPSEPLVKFFKKFSNIDYRTADLAMKDVDDTVDITNMEIYKDESFDMFICSHVLEHIEDDGKAIKELYRILANKGCGVLLVPINLDLDSDYENRMILDEINRIKHFGQSDHVRTYSKSGFINKLSSAGFSVKQLDVNYFGENIFMKYGLNRKSVLYVVEK